MPNWCQNVVYIDHDDKEKLNQIEEYLSKDDEDGFFNLLVPYPGEWDYDWCITNWGTKWDAQVYEYSINDQGKLYVSFDTAWGPPIVFYDKLGEMGYEVEAFYREEGMAFAGWYIDGEDNYYEYGGMSADEIDAELPVELNEMFSIAQYQRDYEEEQRMEEEQEYFDSLEKTEWYPASVNPVRVGVYEIKTESWPYAQRQEWDGEKWCWIGTNDAFPNKVSEWRGITESEYLDAALDELSKLVAEETIDG